MNEKLIYSIYSLISSPLNHWNLDRYNNNEMRRNTLRLHKKYIFVVKLKKISLNRWNEGLKSKKTAFIANNKHQRTCGDDALPCTGSLKHLTRHKQWNQKSSRNVSPFFKEKKSLLSQTRGRRWEGKATNRFWDNKKYLEMKGTTTKRRRKLVKTRAHHKKLFFLRTPFTMIKNYTVG